MRLYAHVMPVCSIDAPAVSGVVLEPRTTQMQGGMKKSTNKHIYNTVTISCSLINSACYENKRF